MPKYTATIRRSVHQIKSIEVEATDMDTALLEAYRAAGDEDFSGLEKEAEYCVTDIRKEKS